MHNILLSTILLTLNYYYIKFKIYFTMYNITSLIINKEYLYKIKKTILISSEIQFSARPQDKTIPNTTIISSSKINVAIVYSVRIVGI